ncbi:MAG: hypothetical protein JSW48_11395 [Betaproteobacteria bacterium]|jgi:hypothetical protein|nr:MAG: hypothetical protein JSW48_11395 [Betaproteobacteria bacterium]
MKQVSSDRLAVAFCGMFAILTVLSGMTTNNVHDQPESDPPCCIDR